MKTLRKIHLWLSVPFGIIITLVCFSGAMLVFEKEITRHLQSDVYYVTPGQGAPLPVETLTAIVERSLSDSVTIKGVTIPDDASRSYQFDISRPKHAAIFINQYTGEITGRTARPAFFTTMFRLHRWLLDGGNPRSKSHADSRGKVHVDSRDKAHADSHGKVHADSHGKARGDSRGKGLKIGKLVVGISTIMFVLALLTGIVLWIPRARKNLRKSLSLSTRKGWHLFWHGLHIAGGMYAALFLLLMALTGLTWSFGWYREIMAAICPDRSLIYALHAGSWGGLPTKILWFLSSLLGASLPLTGYYLWLHRLKSR